MGDMRRAAILLLATSFVFEFAGQSLSQTGPDARPTKEQLASDNNLFISLAKKVLNGRSRPTPSISSARSISSAPRGSVRSCSRPPKVTS